MLLVFSSLIGRGKGLSPETVLMDHYRVLGLDSAEDFYHLLGRLFSIFMQELLWNCSIHYRSSLLQSVLALWWLVSLHGWWFEICLDLALMKNFGQLRRVSSCFSRSVCWSAVCSVFLSLIGNLYKLCSFLRADCDACRWCRTQLRVRMFHFFVRMVRATNFDTIRLSKVLVCHQLCWSWA